MVLSYSFWQRLFNSDPNVIGRSITVNGVAAGENLSAKFVSLGGGVFELKLSAPLRVARGKLTVRAGQGPVVETAEHKLITLDGDEPTRKVLNDRRVNGFEMEARGHFTAPNRFYTRRSCPEDWARAVMTNDE